MSSSLKLMYLGLPLPAFLEARRAGISRIPLNSPATRPKIPAFPACNRTLPCNPCDRIVLDVFVKVRKSDEQVWVLVGMDLERQSLEVVTVFSLERDELVLINVDGELERLLRFAMLPAQEHRDSLRGDNPARI